MWYSFSILVLSICDMALNDSTLSIKLTVNADSNDQTYTIEDTYDYASESIGLTKIEALAKVTSPAGDVILDGLTTPDWSNPLINHDISVISGEKSLSGSLDDVNGDILHGDYVIDYRLRRAVKVNQVTATSSIEIAGEFDSTVLVPGETITIDGCSNAANNGDFVIVSSVAGAGVTTITVTSVALVTETPGGANCRIYYDRQFTLCYDLVKTDVDFTVSHSCVTTKISGVDDTVYPASETINSRLYTVKAPVKADGTNVVPDVTYTTANFSINPIYTGTYTVSLLVDLTEVLTSGIVVNYTAGGTKYHTVDCGKSIANIVGCLYSIITKILSNCGCGKISPKEQCVLNELNSYFTLLMIYDATGDIAKVNEISDLIYAIAEEYACDCVPADGENNPVLVTNSFTTLLASAADISVVTNYNYTNVQGAIEYWEQNAGLKEIVHIDRASEYTHGSTEWAGYTTDPDLDFLDGNSGLLIEFDYDSDNAGGILGVKIDGVDTGLSYTVGVQVGKAVMSLVRKQTLGMNGSMISTEKGFSSGMPTLGPIDYDASHVITVYWVAQPGTGNIRQPIVTRINEAFTF